MFSSTSSLLFIAMPSGPKPKLCLMEAASYLTRKGIYSRNLNILRRTFNLLICMVSTGLKDAMDKNEDRNHWPADEGKSTPPHGTMSTIFDKEMRVSKISNPEMIIEYLTSEENIAQIHHALILGIKDYFRKMGFRQAILGSSGGVDSAVTLALACEALGTKNVRAVLMPSAFSSSHSVSDAEQLSQNLGNSYDIIPIKNIYESFLHSLEPTIQGSSIRIGRRKSAS